MKNCYYKYVQVSFQLQRLMISPWMFYISLFMDAESSWIQNSPVFLKFMHYEKKFTKLV